MKTTPSLIAGGTISHQHIVKAFARDGAATLLKTKGAAEQDIYTSSGAFLESYLYLHIKKTLQKNALRTSGIEYILFYLWEHYLFTRKYSFTLRRNLLHEKQIQTGLLT